MSAFQHTAPALRAPVIRCADATAQSERDEWTGATPRAKFQGAAEADRASVRGVSFGRKVR